MSSIPRTPRPSPSDGAEVLGSGNWEMPCRRMHRAMFRNFANVCLEGGAPSRGRGAAAAGISRALR